MDTYGNYIPRDGLYSLGAQTARLYKPSGVTSASGILSELSAAVKNINAAHDVILRRFGRSPSMPASCEWLLDNRYAAVRQEKLIRAALSRKESLRKCGEGPILFLLCRRLLCAAADRLCETACRDFLLGFQSVTVLSTRELSLLPAGLGFALLLRLSDLCTELLKSSEPESFGDTFAALFTSLSLLSSIDMKALCDSVDVTEGILESESAGVYARSDEKTRAYYRRLLFKLANKRGVSEHECARELVDTAKAKGTHVGALLTGEKCGKSAALYIAVYALLTLFLTVLCGFLSHSVAAAFLLLLPISELTKSLTDHVLLLCVEPAFQPRLDLSDGIPDEGRSICVISALTGSVDAAVEASARLEEASLKNRDGSGNLLFGLLADLPEASTVVTDKDAAVIAALKTEIAALNLRYGGGFFLFTRSRVELSDGRYGGHERKRGAVLALSELLCGKSGELYVAAGDTDALSGTRYIITLDADTSPAPDSVRELIAAMLHPQNRCVLDRALGRTVGGFGIIHPRIGTELESVYANDFSRIFAGVGGSEPYSSSCGEVYMDLFQSGGFYGKGIIDAEALSLCSRAHIPDGEVLSHDALEGAYLHGAFMSDVEFCDSFPKSPAAYYRRLHRWTRGDWQNCPWVFCRRSELSDIDRFKLFDSLRRSLVSPAIFVSIFLGLSVSARGLTLALCAALLSLAAGLIIGIGDALCGKLSDTRYHSSLLYGVGLSLLQSLVRLWMLPYEAWICLSAAVTALWRMLVSGKKLLEWETSAQSGDKRHGLFYYFKSMWFAALSGLALLFISPSVLGKAAGLMWLLSPLALYALSLPYGRQRQIKSEDKAYLLGIAKDIWSYFKTFCTADDNYLPPDNYQMQPPVGLAHRTSPTNIGLALCSALCAADLGIDGGKGPELIENMLTTLERMPKKYGHFYNWYDTRTLRPMHPKYLSAVDCGNLLACLIVLKNGLAEHRFFALSKRVEALIAPMDLSVFYDPARGLFRIGIDAEKDIPSSAHYDLLASEARLTSYLAVAKGDVPKKHWEALSRAMRGYRGYTGMASWTGTMFEYLMPELFLPLYRNSLIFETAKYCVYVQKHRRAPSGIWGISESAFFSLDPSLCYRYKAHGCSALALKRGQDSELVISPYSSFLSLCVDPKASLCNIRRMEALGLRGRFGFIEAVDFTPSRCGGEGGEAVRSYMAHHQGMSLLSAANLISDNIVVRRMMSEPCVRAYSSLLREKLPIEPIVLDLPENTTDKDRAYKRRSFELRGEGFDFLHPHCCMLTNGSYSIMSTETAVSSSRLGDVAIYSSPTVPYGEGRGVELYLDSESGRVSLLPESDADYLSAMWELSENRCSYVLETELFRSKCSVAVSESANGELRFLELCAKADLGEATIELCFEPVLAVYEDHINHPAYWRLGITAESFGGCLMLHRLHRGNTPDLWLCVSCDKMLSFSADPRSGLGAVSKPFVRLCHHVSLSAGQKLKMRFCICVAADRDSAFEGAQLMLANGPSEYGSMVSAYANALDMDGKGIAAAMERVLPLHFFMRSNVFTAKDALWKYGISGDRPIVLCPLGMSREAIEDAVKQRCLLISCGLECDLALLCDEGGDYLRPVYSAVRDTLCAYGLEPLMNSDGSVHLLPKEAESAFRACASYVIGEKSPYEPYEGKLLSVKRQKRASTVAPEYEFDKSGTFVYYVNSLPPRAWTYILTNGRLGYIASDNGCGNMWYKNAREMRISPWQNDPVGAYPAETLEYLRDGKRISLFADDELPCRISYGFGCARRECSVGDTGIRCTAFIPPNVDVRIFVIEFCGSLTGELAWKLPLQLGGDCKDKNAVSINYVNSFFEAVGARSGFDCVLRAGFHSAPVLHFTDLYEWQTQTPSENGFGSYPIFGAKLPLAPVCVIACGICEPDVLMELCKPDAALALMSETKAYWQKLLSVFKLKSTCAPLDHYMNGHGLYQSLACRIMGRCSIYQSGGAIGFRDQLQDAVNLIFARPEAAKRQILTCCAHQYEEGDVMHWWHPLPDGDRGVRTRCSDDLLWLCWALCEYVEKTGDTAACEIEINYVNSSVLSDRESDRYEMPSRSGLCESVLLHAKRAVDLVIERGTGPHGLLFFGSGDWNDGMDKINGESVWLSLFFAHTVRRFADLLLTLCKLDSHYYRAKAWEIGTAAESAWDGDRYLRGYWPDGTPLGSKRNVRCSIDSVCQSWAAFCCDASNSRVDIALGTALDELYDRENGIVKLFTPPFFESERDPGYIASYGEGFRENGGQYTHAAIWLASACLRRGRENDGFAILRDLLPENHDPLRYEAEPFVLPADVYSCPDHEGEAGWTWYTGSAAWYLRVVIEDLLGLRLYGGRIYIRPHLPNGFGPCRIRFAGYDIRIDGEEIMLDGEKYDGKGIPYPK